MFALTRHAAPAIFSESIPSLLARFTRAFEPSSISCAVA
jgi:hypothetical protein